MPVLLILWHSRTGASAALAEAAAVAASKTQAVNVQCIAAVDASVDQLGAADAYLFVGPENLGALSGGMKELLDRCYYPLLGQVEGRAYGHIVAAGSDGEGAARQLARIVTGWRLKQAMDPVIIRLNADTPAAIMAQKFVVAASIARAQEAGMLLAEGLAIGHF
jgi:multimeric flavodoxin WrbA